MDVQNVLFKIISLDYRRRHAHVNAWEQEGCLRRDFLSCVLGPSREETQSWHKRREATRLSIALLLSDLLLRKVPFAKCLLLVCTSYGEISNLQKSTSLPSIRMNFFCILLFFFLILWQGPQVALGYHAVGSGA